MAKKSKPHKATKKVKLVFRDDIPMRVDELLYHEIARQVIKKPGRWALIDEKKEGSAWALASRWRRHECPRAFRPRRDGHFEFAATAKGHPRGRGGVYVRFISTPPTTERAAQSAELEADASA